MVPFYLVQTYHDGQNQNHQILMMAVSVCRELFHFANNIVVSCLILLHIIELFEPSVSQVNIKMVVEWIRLNGKVEWKEATSLLMLVLLVPIGKILISAWIVWLLLLSFNIS
jgi:hypothetical protein